MRERLPVFEDPKLHSHVQCMNPVENVDHAICLIKR